MKTIQVININTEMTNNIKIIWNLNIKMNTIMPI